jgi:4-amino-4-deoxy-L-arabinose transferase-like glycosyltransferase
LHIFGKYFCGIDINIHDSIYLLLLKFCTSELHPYIKSQMKPRYLYRLSLICFWIGASFQLITIILYLLVPHQKIDLWNQNISFDAIITHIKISLTFVLMGLFFVYLYNHQGWYAIILILKKIINGFSPKIISLNFKTLVKKVDWVLVLFLVISGFFRLWGIGFGLPHLLARPDEERVVGIALNFFNQDYNPHFFSYPTLYMYLLHAVYSLFFSVGSLLGFYNSILDLEIERSLDPSFYFLVDRWLSAGFGIVTIFVVYKIGSLLFNRKTALISSISLGVTYLHVRESHFGVTDIPITFFIMASIVFIIKSYQEKNLKNYILAGCFAGAATAVKYSGLLLAIPMVVVHFLNVIENKENKWTLLVDKRLLLFLLMVLYLFFLGSPYVFLDYQKFLTDFIFEMNHLKIGHTIVLGKGWWYHTKFTFFYGMSWGQFLFSMLGLLFVAKDNIKKALILFSFPIMYFGLSGGGYSVFVRYMVPVIPFLCISGAVSITTISEKAKRVGLIYYPVILGIILLISLGPSLYNVFQFDRLLSKKDNRLIAAEWIQKNILEGSSIYQACSIYGKLQLRRPLNQLNEIATRDPDSKTRLLIKEEIHFMEKNQIRGYDEYIYDEPRRRFIEKEYLPDYILLESSSLILYSRIPEGIQKLLDTFYFQRKFFESMEIKAGENLFDQQDAFYLPFIGFSMVQRPGPNLLLFQKRGLDNP